MKDSIDSTYEAHKNFDGFQRLFILNYIMEIKGTIKALNIKWLSMIIFQVISKPKWQV